MRNVVVLATALIVSTVSMTPLGQEGANVVMISIDGLMPASYLTPGSAKIPALTAMKQEGAYAEGVVGVLPSVTYASHTTLITGVRPAQHGIYDNSIFDPENRSNEAWFWYARDIRVPTLIDAARQRGLSTAAISWPVSVGAAADFLVPEFWRTGSSHVSDGSLIRALSTPGLFDAIEKSRGSPLPHPQTDKERTDMAIHILTTHRPRVLLLHLLSLDGAQHGSGPGSERAVQTLEQLDGYVGRIRDAVRTAGLADRTYVAIVSDHGFATIERQIQPNALFKSEGLLKVDAGGRVTEWQAYFHASGGAGFVFLKNPSDTALRDRVGKLLEGLRADPGNGIASLWSREDLQRLGAQPDASFGIGMRPGFYTGSGHDALTAPTRNRGGHGFDPELPELRASLLVTGPAVRGRGNLGLVRMTQIAPSFARLLGVALSAEADTPIAFAQPAASPAR